eukprot:TRINITY_DN817_c0_g1_i9.p1 TRINITY_DN817_c0_g1~~TRINITY_DN817_c0_g1_i9.p1  ORF type:complete len:498 (+),score=50.21 TRINITY_DN817_c0_g1_i9:58-1551(+)
MLHSKMGLPMHRVTIIVMIFIRMINSQMWIEQITLEGKNEPLTGSFGISVAITNKHVLVGAHLTDISGVKGCGSAYIYSRSGTSWSESTLLTADHRNAFDRFGYAVALSSRYAFVGNPWADPEDVEDAGVAYIFSLQGSFVTKVAIITASNKATFDHFAQSLSITDNLALVGAPWANYNSVSDVGAAYIFSLSGEVWIEHAILRVKDYQLCGEFGYSVSLTNTFALIGADDSDHSFMKDVGSAYVFARSNKIWAEQATLTASIKKNKDYFGESVSLTSNYALIGLYESNYAFLFSRLGTVWTQKHIFESPSGQKNVAITDNYMITFNHLYKKFVGGWIFHSLMPQSPGSQGSVALTDNFLIIGNYDLPLESKVKIGKAYVFINMIRETLVDLFGDTFGHNWNIKTSWNTSEPICRWYGITCNKDCSLSDVLANNCKLREIDLRGNNLQGQLPFLNFPDLDKLDLGENFLTGTIPNLNMPLVRFIQIDHNILTGNITP